MIDLLFFVNLISPSLTSTDKLSPIFRPDSFKTLLFKVIAWLLPFLTTLASLLIRYHSLKSNYITCYYIVITCDIYI